MRKWKRYCRETIPGLLSLVIYRFLNLSFHAKHSQINVRENILRVGKHDHCAETITSHQLLSERITSLTMVPKDKLKHPTCCALITLYYTVYEITNH